MSRSRVSLSAATHPSAHDGDRDTARVVGASAGSFGRGELGCPARRGAILPTIPDARANRIKINEVSSPYNVCLRHRVAQPQSSHLLRGQIAIGSSLSGGTLGKLHVLQNDHRLDGHVSLASAGQDWSPPRRMSIRLWRPVYPDLGATVSMLLVRVSILAHAVVALRTRRCSVGAR